MSADVCTGGEWAVWMRTRPTGRWRIVATGATKAEADGRMHEVMADQAGPGCRDWMVLKAGDKP